MKSSLKVIISGKLDKSDFESRNSSTQEPPYIEQYERMLRWYRAIQPIDISSHSSTFMPSYLSKEDIFFAFFTSCYHFKDWLKESLKTKESKDKVEKYVKNSLSLTVCDEICNHSKHLKLTSNKHKPQRNINTRGFELGVLRNSFGPGPSFHDSIYVIKRGKEWLDALKVARACIKEWQNFLKTHKLAIPK